MQSSGGILGFLTGANDPGMQMFILFDSPYNAYYVGQNVTGRVVVRVQKPKTFRNITVNCKGEAHVEWTEDRTEQDKDGQSRTVTDLYTGNEVYFENTVMVSGGSVGEMGLQPGEFNYPFNFPLPNHIPSSFEGEYGYIRYTVKAVMDRPWKFNHESKTAFTVVSPLDLNTISSVKEPVREQKSKTFCCCCCKSGPLELTVELPCSGYVPGQTIPFKVDIENASKVLVHPVNCVLRKEVTWTVQSPSYKQKVEKVVIANVAVNESVEPHSNKTFSQDIKIPSVPPSNLHNCRIIDLEYIFKVEAVAGTFHKNLSARIPITLGTVPLLTGPTKFVPPLPAPAPVPSAPEKGDLPDDSSVPAPGQPQPAGFMAPTDPSSAPSAPPLYPDLPPPSYEESVFGGQNIKDANDGEHTQGLTNFTPRYPVWNFGQQK